MYWSKRVDLPNEHFRLSKSGFVGEIGFVKEDDVRGGDLSNGDEGRMSTGGNKYTLDSLRFGDYHPLRGLLPFAKI